MNDSSLSSVIFCPNNHLVLNAPCCPKCSWTRPPRGRAGQPAWDLSGLAPGGLAGFPAGAPAGTGALEGVLGVPLPGELLGLGLADGQLRWRSPLPGSFRLRGLVPHGRRWLAAVDQEENNLLAAASPAWLAAVDPLSGKIETLWRSRGAWLTRPVLSGEDILLCTATRELLVFAAHDFSAPRASARLMGAWRHPPAVGQGLVLVGDGRAMKGEAFALAAFAQEDLRELWRVPLAGRLPEPPLILPGLLVQRGERGLIQARELTSGQLVWEYDAEKIYSPLLAAAGLVFFAARGSPEVAAPDHYCLVGLEQNSGKVVVSAGLPGRVCRLVLAEDAHLLLATDQGHLLCCDLEGQPLWTLKLSSEEDPFRSELLAAGGLAALATCSGRILAVRVSAESDEPGDPAVLIQAGRPREAAAVLALRGALGEAAELYARELNEPANALALLEQAQLWPVAASLAWDQKRYDLARGYFLHAGDLSGEARSLERLGDQIAAAQTWERAGNWERAGANYEAAGEPVKAWEMYHRAKDLVADRRMLNNLPADLRTIELLEKKGQYIEAGEVAERASLLDRAAKLYERGGEAQRLLAVLVRILNEHPAEWALRRLAELARADGNFGLEATAWEKLAGLKLADAPREAAAACQRAARQAEARGEAPERIAVLYESALRWFEQDYNDDEKAACWTKVVRFRQLPQVSLLGRPGKVFRELEQNTLYLDLENYGHGVAVEISVALASGNFLVDESTSELSVSHLNPGSKKTLVVSLRPQKDAIGEVGLNLNWRWKSRQGTAEYSGHSTLFFNVKRLNEPGGASTPSQVFHIGTMIQADGVEIVGGDKLAIQRGPGISVRAPQDRHLETEAAGCESPKCRACPRCNLPVQENEAFCGACGADMRA